jgi:hypothetical protein
MKILFYISLLIFLLSCANTPNKTMEAQADTLAKSTTPSAVAAMAANGFDNYEYQPHLYEFHGLLMKRPVFDEAHEDVAIDSFYCIKLDKKINAVSTDTVDESESTELAVDTLQLAPASGVNINGLFYRNVTVTGSLFHSDNGNQLTPVLIWTTGVH